VRFDPRKQAVLDAHQHSLGRAIGWRQLVAHALGLVVGLLTPCFSLGAQPAQEPVRSDATIQIHDAGQARLFRIAGTEPSRVQPARPGLADTTGGRDGTIILLEADRTEGAFSRRSLTKKLIAHLRTGVDPRFLNQFEGVITVQPQAHAPGWFLVELAEPAAVLAFVEQLRSRPEVLAAEPLLAKRQRKKLVPDDPLFARQWHLHNTGQNGALPGIDAGLTNAWESVRGGSVVIGIVDDGLDDGHVDLAPNVVPELGWDFNDDDASPKPDPAHDFHGTACAGIAAARGGNASGVAGAAYEARLAGLRLIAAEPTDDQMAAALLHSNRWIQVKSQSWGPDDDGETLEGPGVLAAAALAEGVRSGRDGRGTVYVWSAGNGLDANDDANYDGYANSIYTIAVTSVSDRGERTDYAEPGACIVVAAPSHSIGRQEITTTDLTGADGYNRFGPPGDFENLDYTQTFMGTSASTPLVAGVVALMLDARPMLGWRDVQEILLRSATVVSPADPDWITNAAGIHVNHKFGAGLVNASAAVAQARAWALLGPQTNLLAAAPALDLPISDTRAAPLEYRFDFGSAGLRVEHVTLRLHVAHPSRGQLRISLVSPAGTLSRLAEPRGDAHRDYVDWTFMSVRHWGEAAQGTWTLTITDESPGETGRLVAADLTLYGTDSGGSLKPLLVDAATWVDAPGGNANGVLEPGETARETVVLRNVSAPLPSFVARLGSNNPGVRMIAAAAPFPASLPGESITNVSAFEYVLDVGVLCGTTLEFELVAELEGVPVTNVVRHLVGQVTGTWDLETVDAAGAVGSHTSLALDALERPHISYYAITSTDLMYAWWNGSRWMAEVVDAAGSVGTHNSLALDAGGGAHVTFRDQSARSLKYAVREAAGWRITTIDAGPGVGMFTSLVLDAAGRPHVSYYDDANGDLRYARWDGAAWQLELVDAAGTVGTDTSLALDTLGRPWIAYRDATNEDLKIALRDGGVWQARVVDPTGEVGADTSLQLTQEDAPRISYRDTGEGDLKFASWDGAQWLLQVVDSAGAVGYDTSLALDSQDQPHISYWDVTNADLKYASRAGAAWQLETVDTEGVVGAYTSLALTMSGNPRISYRDTTRGDLKFASFDSPGCSIYSPPPADGFRISSIAASASDILINFQSQPGSVYQLERAAGPDDRDWLPASPEILSDGTVQRVSDRGALSSASSRFYRIRRLR
jgi:subtilisin-like proprotein convertase family protein